MAQLGIRDLVGRAMIDKEFLGELVRDPATVLRPYELTPEERAAIMQAVARCGESPERERARALGAILMKRWAT